ncbi:MAG TPA: sensor histidine kinase [Prolixibacteraceae bacterium]|nr:sensor histidine kinase [Prolixibacteraceae bacterium]
MKRKNDFSLLLLILLTFGILSGYAQRNTVADSLIQTIRVSPDDTAKVSCLNELSWLFRIEKPDSAFIYANKAKSLAEKINFKAGIATSLSRIGEIERIRGNYNQAITAAIHALEIEKEINHAYGIGRANEQLTLLYTNVGQTENAIKAGQVSIEIWKDLKNFSALANAYDRQAILLIIQGKLDDALVLTYRGQKIREQLKDSINMVYSFMSLGYLYTQMLENDKALEFFNKAIDLAVKHNDQISLATIYTNIGCTYFNLGQFKSAINYNLESIEIKKSLKQYKTIDTNYDNLGQCYSELKEYDQAIWFYNKCIELKKEFGKNNLSTVYTNIGNLYLARNQYHKAVSYYEKGLENAKKNGEKLIILELYHNIYRSYTAMGKLEDAVFYNNQYITLRDSIDATYRNAMNLKDAYQEEQKKNQLLQKDNLINEIKLKRRNVLIASLSVGVILLTLLFLALFRSYRFRQRTLLAEKNNEISEQKISELLKNQELNSINAMLEGQEGERKRIAQDLHDRLGSMLSMVKLHFKSVEDNIQAMRESNMVMYNKANNLLDEACEEVRKIANDLNSGVLTKFGLIPALKSLQESIAATGQLNIEVLDFGFDDDRLEYDIEINLYRVIQELISNILKHANASEVTIQLLKKDKRLNVVVEDNGIGFDVNKVKNKKGMGLRNIESRINSLDGELNIDSGKGAGTTITINIPL